MVDERARNERDSSCTRCGLLEKRAVASTNGPRQSERAGPRVALVAGCCWRTGPSPVQTGPGRVNGRARNERDSSCTRSRAAGGTGRRQDKTGPGRVNGRARNERHSSCTRRGLLAGPDRVNWRARNERDSSCTRRGLLAGPDRVNWRARNERDSSCIRRGLLEKRAVARTNGHGPRQSERAGPQRARLELHSSRAAGGRGRRQDKLAQAE